MRERIARLMPALAAGLLAVALFTGQAAAWYPNAVLAEDGTATWCGYCPNAYAGLEANKGWYDVNEFSALRYYANSGGYSCQTSTTRLGYYGINSYPTVMFGGYVRTVGAGAETATGLPYKAIIETLLADPTYFKIKLNSMTHTQNSMTVSVTVTVMEGVPDISGMKLRIIAAEDNIPYSAEIYQDVTIGSNPDIAITVSQIGQTQTASVTFPIAPWLTSPTLEAVAFVQDDATKTIYASAGSHPNPDYSLRYYALGERAVIGPADPVELFQFEPFRVYNFGNLTDSYTISVVVDGPADWFATLCSPGGLCYGPTLTTTLAPGQYIDLDVSLIAASSGYGLSTVTMTQANYPAGWERPLRFLYMTDDLQLLLVDDDGGLTYEDYFTDAVSYAGYHPRTYAVWDRSLGAPSNAIMSQFEAVVWWTGLNYPTLDADDRAQLGAFLDAGGSLFVTGQEIGWELNDAGDAVYQWYRNYLHANFVVDDTNDYTLDGVAGDPISDGLNLVIQGGDGANNQTYPDAISPADGAASIIWKYNTTQTGAIKANAGDARLVYFGFGYEAIRDAAMRRETMARILDWLIIDPADIADSQPVYRPSFELSPNPVQSQAAMRFTLPQAGSATLKIYGLDGRVVRTLIDGTLEAGNHTRLWDRTDAQGARLPAGIYCYRLAAPQIEESGKVVLVR